MQVVLDDGVSDVGQQGRGQAPLRLLLHHGQSLAPPVEVGPLQADDVARPQAQAQGQKEDRIIPPLDRRPPLKGGEETLLFDSGEGGHHHRLAAATAGDVTSGPG